MKKYEKKLKKKKTTDLELVLTKINKKTYYKTINSTDSLPATEFLPLDKQFIQVELEQNDKKFCIHEYLDSFYLVNNTLFTTAWLKWYLQRFFNEKLEDTYTIHIIDKDVNLFKINESQQVMLNSDGYEVCSSIN